MKVLKSLIVIFFLVGLHFTGLAAPAPPTTGAPTCWPPPCVPIDGGVSFLIAAGALYGAKKIYSNRRKA